MTANDLLKTMRDQIDRLFETSPAIPEPVIKAFKHRYGEDTDVKRPEIANGIDPIEIYQEPPQKSIGDAVAKSPAISINFIDPDE